MSGEQTITGICKLDDVFASVVPDDGQSSVLFARDLCGDLEHGDKVSVRFHPINGVTELKNINTGIEYVRN